MTKLALLHDRADMEKRLLEVSADQNLRASVYPFLLQFAGQKIARSAIKSLVVAAFKDLAASIGQTRANQYQDRYEVKVASAIIKKWLSQKVEDY